MDLLFSAEGMKKLDQIVQPGLLCVFDFDGTLSPIVASPEQASLPREVCERLVALSQLVPVAVLTGRSVADVSPRLNFKPAYVIGNHGAEGMPGWESRAARYEEICQGWKTLLSMALEDPGNFGPDVVIEDKRYSLSVHYRMAANQAQVRAQLEQLFAELVPSARVVAGKCVFNLLPPGAADKGQALEYLMRTSGAPAAIYVGDDVTDEDVFRLRRPDLLSVRIEEKSESAAEYYVPHWLDIVQLLDELISRLQRFDTGTAKNVEGGDNDGSAASKCGIDR